MTAALPIKDGWPQSAKTIVEIFIYAKTNMSPSANTIEYGIDFRSRIFLYTSTVQDSIIKTAESPASMFPSTVCPTHLAICIRSVMHRQHSNPIPSNASQENLLKESSMTPQK